MDQISGGDEVSEQTVGLLLQNLYAHRQTCLDALDAMDAKAGVLFGFAGVLIALVATVPLWWLRLLVIAPCLITVGFCFAALMVRRLRSTDARQVWKKYILEAPDRTARTLLDTLTDQQGDLESVLERKADFVTVALYALVVAIGFMTIVVLLAGGVS